MNTKGFTLIEILIVIAILALISTSVLMGNFMSQIRKARNARRIGELTHLMKVLEDYYNDKGSYPPVLPGTIDGLNCKDNPGGLSPYLSAIPCDPSYPGHTYIYVSDDNTYQKIRIYAVMESPIDASLSKNPCNGGCTISCAGCNSDGKTFTYIIASPNVDIVSNPIPPASAIIP